MAKSVIHTDPDRIMALADELRLFTNTLRTDLTSLDEALGHLGASWKDGEFEQFRDAHRKLSHRLEMIGSEINKHEPQLKADAEALAHYLRLQNP